MDNVIHKCMKTQICLGSVDICENVQQEQISHTNDYSSTKIWFSNL